MNPYLGYKIRDKSDSLESNGNLHASTGGQKKLQTYRYRVFGRLLIVEKTAYGWATYYPGSEGKRRQAGLVIPNEIDERELTQYLDDLCHEWACEEHPNVIRLGEL